MKVLVDMLPKRTIATPRLETLRGQRSSPETKRTVGRADKRVAVSDCSAALRPQIVQMRLAVTIPVLRSGHPIIILFERGNVPTFEISLEHALPSELRDSREAVLAHSSKPSNRGWPDVINMATGDRLSHHHRHEHGEGAFFTGPRNTPCPVLRHIARDLVIDYACRLDG